MAEQKRFDEQNCKGTKAERRVAGEFFTANWAICKHNPDGSMDLAATQNGVPFRLEVKNEDDQIHTGNLCIEQFQGREQRRRSGLCISESTACVHTLGDNCAAYRTQSMRLFLEDAGGAYREIAFKNSDNGNGGILVPIAHLKDRPWFQHCPLKDLPSSRVFTWKP